jgi:IS30 family transposase
MEKPKPDNPFDNLGDLDGKVKKKSKPETNFTPPGNLTEEEKERIKVLASEGKGVNEIARTLKRSAATVSRAFKKLHISKAVALFKAGKLVDQKLNAAQQLRKINDKANAILDDTDPKDPDTVLKAMAEIRNQLKLQLDIFQTLYNLEEVAKWQNEILDILGEVAPDARDRFYERLQQRRVL